MEYQHASDDTLGRRGIFNPLLLAVAIALAEETRMDPLDLLTSHEIPPFVEDAESIAMPVMLPDAQPFYELVA